MEASREPGHTRLNAPGARLGLHVKADADSFSIKRKKGVETVRNPVPGRFCVKPTAASGIKGGTTAVANGRFLCGHHHHKRHKGWTVRYEPDTGRCEVTSPAGLTFSNDPDPPPGGQSP